MWHNRRPQNANGHINHVAVVQDLRRRKATQRHRTEVRLGQHKLNAETHRDDADEREHQHLNQAESFILQVKDGQHVAGC